MHQARGSRKGQRFSMMHASRENRFAAVKAALRKQSLTFEPYSEEVIHALWGELQERHAQGVYCMLRKGLQNALLVRLARPLNGGRMSKNKVNKIFQVLIRSCFVLHSRGGHGDDVEHDGGFPCQRGPAAAAAAAAAAGGDGYQQHGGGSGSLTGRPGWRPSTQEDMVAGAVTTAAAAAIGNGSSGAGGNNNINGRGCRYDSSRAASPGTTGGGDSGGETAAGPSQQPFSLDTEMDWTATGELVPRRHLVRAGGGAAGLMDKTLTPSASVAAAAAEWEGCYAWARSKAAAVTPDEKRACAGSAGSGGGAGSGDSDLSLTPEEARVFSRTGILPCAASSPPVRPYFRAAVTTAAAAAAAGGGGGGGTAYNFPSPSADRDILRRLSLSPASAKRDLRRSVSSEDLLAGLRIRMDDLDVGGEQDGSDFPFGPEGEEAMMAGDSQGGRSAPGGHMGVGLMFDDTPRDGMTRASTAAPSSARGTTACEGSSSIGSGGQGHPASGGGGGGGRGVGGFEQEEDESSAGAVCELREDVGSVEEVILTHNAFIRKVASEAGIRLPAGEWAAFFGYDQPVSAELEAARSRPAPPLPPPQADPLGHMNKDQLNKFRTAWCTRSHPHVEEFCEHGHEEVNHGWLRRDPSKHPYLPRLCERIILPGPGGEYLDGCTRGRSCPNAHSLEEIQYHHQSYKTQVCPHGSKCRSKAFCPHAHILGSDNDIASAAAAAAAAAGAAAGGGRAAKRPSPVLRRSSSSSCSASPRPCSVDAATAAAGDGYGRGGSGAVGGGRVAEEGWQTVAKRGRRAPSPAESEIRAWAPPARIRSRSWSASDLLSPSAEGGGGGHNHHRGSSREFRRRATGVTGLLAALRKRSADVMQPPAKHNELLRTIYSTLRRREPNGCDEKELVGRVFHSSMSASAERRGGGGDANAGTPAGVSVAGGGGGGNTGDAPESHRFSKTKVRGAVTLLKFAQAVRVGRGDTAGQHVLYVAYELPTFSDFMARHNSHLVDMARELGVDMTAMDWKSLLETEQSSGRGGGRPIPSPSPTDQSESSASAESPAAGGGDAPRLVWVTGSPNGAHWRPSPCPKPPSSQQQQQQQQQQQRFVHGAPLPSPPSRQGTPQSPAGQNGHGCRSLSSSPTVQPSPQDNEQQFAPRASSEHALWHGGQLLQLQPTHPRPPQQQQQHHHHHHQVGIQQYIQQLPSPQQQLSQPPPPPPSSAAVGGVWGQQATGPQALPPRGVQGVAPPQAGLVSPAAPSPTAMKQGQEQALLSMPLPPPPPPAMVSAQVGGVGGYGMVLPLRGSPLDGFPGCGSQGSCSPLGYGLGGNGGNLTPSPQRRQQQQQLHLPVLASHAAVAPVQPHQVYGFGHVQQGTAVGGGQVHHPSSHAGLSWAPGLVGQGPHGGGGGGGASRQMTMEEAASAASAGARAGAEGVTEPPPPPPSSLGQRESGEQFPAGTSSSAQSLPGDVSGPAGGVGGASFSGAPSAGGMMQAPVPVALELRRQSSLPPLSGSSPQPAFTGAGARMAHTPPAIASGRLGFPPSGGGEKGSDPRATSDATGADAAAAAAAVAAGGGAAEAWERERSRFGVRGNRPSPVESRIAAVAIAAQNAAAAEATEENKNGASAAAVGPGAVPRDNSSPPEPAVATTDSTAPAAAAAVVAPGFAESAAKGTAELSARHPYATDDGGDALDVGLGELSLAELGGGGDTAALPGLNEIASNSRRYKMF